MSQQNWEIRDIESNSSTFRRTVLQQVIVRQGDRRTAPICVNDVRLENRLNDICRLTIGLSLPSERVLCNSSGIAIDELILSAESIEAVSRSAHFCWDLEVELIPRERIYRPHENIYRFSVPVRPMVVTGYAWLDMYAGVSVSMRSFAGSEEELSRFQADYERFVSPPQAKAPTICRTCRNYHGQSYGGNLVVCGFYPYGNGEDCSDYE